MQHYVTPLIFGVLTAYLWHYNGTHADRWLLLPFIDMLFPGETSQQLGQRSVQGGAVLTVVALAWAVGAHVRQMLRGRKKGEDERRTP